MEDLKKEIEQMKFKISELEAKVNDLNNGYNNHCDDIKKLYSKFNSLNSKCVKKKVYLRGDRIR